MVNVFNFSICSITEDFRGRSFSFIYELIATGLGAGDEAIDYDEQAIFHVMSSLMSIFYILGLCHLSGYVSAYYSIKTGNRVQTTSWLQVNRNRGSFPPAFSQMTAFAVTRAKTRYCITMFHLLLLLSASKCVHFFKYG